MKTHATHLWKYMGVRPRTLEYLCHSIGVRMRFFLLANALQSFSTPWYPTYMPSEPANTASSRAKTIGRDVVRRGGGGDEGG